MADLLSMRLDRYEVAPDMCPRVASPWPLVINYTCFSYAFSEHCYCRSSCWSDRDNYRGNSIAMCTGKSYEEKESPRGACFYFFICAVSEVMCSCMYHSPFLSPFKCSIYITTISLVMPAVKNVNCYQQWSKSNTDSYNFGSSS